jgi:hypothetical protein
MAFIANPRRDAHATIAGFFYQVNVTLLRWLSLQPSAHLQLVLRSPLITSELSAVLDPRTRIGVHYVLALQILARKSLAPIEVLTCVHHLTMARDMNFACIVLIQALASLVEMDNVPEDDLDLLRISVASVLGSNADINIRLYLCALHTVVLFRQGRDIDRSIALMDTLLNDARTPSWGSVLSAGTVAIQLIWQRPILANRYLLHALDGASTVKLPDGSLLPTRNYPIEGMLWISAYTAKSDDEADSWLRTISRFTPAQLEES